MGEEAGREPCGGEITPNGSPLLVHQNAPVGIAIKTHAKITPMLADRFLSPAEIGFHQRVGLMHK